MNDAMLCSMAPRQILGSLKWKLSGTTAHTSFESNCLQVSKRKGEDHPTIIWKEKFNIIFYFLKFNQGVSFLNTTQVALLSWRWHYYYAGDNTLNRWSNTLALLLKIISICCYRTLWFRKKSGDWYKSCLQNIKNQSDRNSTKVWSRS